MAGFDGSDIITLVYHNVSQDTLHFKEVGDGSSGVLNFQDNGQTVSLKLADSYDPGSFHIGVGPDGQSSIIPYAASSSSIMSPMQPPRDWAQPA